ncbi:MAG: DNA polymerase III subunit delta [Actinomycetia bacterium]|nr:DNA polymerase III subunit delta [Actinomycetes bacterium]
MPAPSHAATELLAVYLFNGDDELKRDTLLARLRQRVIGPADDLLLNQQVLTPEDLADADQLLDVLTTPPLVGEQRLVIIQQAEKLNKELSETLISYLAQPSSTTVLALLATKLDAKTRLFKALQSYDRRAIINTASVKRSELPELVRQLAQRFQISLDYEAAQSLIERIGSSTQALDNEVRRLAWWAAAAGKRELTAADIVEQVPALVEPKPWELADALSRRQLALVLQMYAAMRSSQPTAIFTNCLARLRELLTILVLRQRGLTSGAQIAQVLAKSEWQIKSSLLSANNFSLSELIDLIRGASAVEKALKSGDDAEQVLELWFLEVCKSTG